MCPRFRSRVQKQPLKVRAAEQRGFTVVELMAVLAITGLIAAIAVPKLASLRGQLKSSEDVRLLAQKLGSLRQEARRLRTQVKVTFSSTGYSWDIYNDGSTEGTTRLDRKSSWNGGTPSAVTFNGLGLTRGISSSVTLGIQNRGKTTSIILNSNGYVER